MKILVLLQNAWSTHHKRDWPYETWVRALRRSRTGQRLSVMFPEPEWNQIAFTNTTNMVGNHPDSILPPNLDYVQATLSKVAPDFLVACGQQAEKVASQLWKGNLIVIPHPACRVLSNQLLQDAKAILAKASPVRIALRQKKGYVEKVEISC